MNISEQITALLHGELTNDKSVAELMHLLSVSPEKRTTFLEHIAVSRSLVRSGGSIAPAPSATEGVWNRIAALNTAPQTTSAAVTQHNAVEKESRWKRYGLLLLLLLAGSGSGYMIGSYNGSASPISAAPAIADAPDNGAPASEQTGRMNTGSMMASDLSGNNSAIASAETEVKESNLTDEIHAQLGAANSSNAPETNQLLAQIWQLTSQIQTEQGRNQELSRQLEIFKADLREASSANNSTENIAANPALGISIGDRLDWPLQTSSAQLPSRVTQETLAANRTEDALPTRRPSTVLELQQRSDIRPWRIEMRQHLRTSLPNVTGLNTPNNVLSDREIGASLQFNALHAPMRLGLAVGQTTFSQVYHTNTGGALNDTIIEQAPQLLYGRAFVAPQIFEGENFAASLEFGVGGLEIGPIGTAGINMEYRTTERVSFHGGISSWLLWTSYRNQLHTSTNLNAHLGVSLTP